MQFGWRALARTCNRFRYLASPRPPKAIVLSSSPANAGCMARIVTTLARVMCCHAPQTRLSNRSSPKLIYFSIIHAWWHELAAQPQRTSVRNVSGSEAARALLDGASLQDCLTPMLAFYGMGNQRQGQPPTHRAWNHEGPGRRTFRGRREGAVESG